MRRLIVAWPCPGGDEFAVALDRGRQLRVLIVPPLFAEMNRTRRLLATTMRALDGHGIDSFLPDLPGTNESLKDLAEQSLNSWRLAMAAAARHFGASHVLALRGGVLVFPNVLPGWVVEPVSGASLLRQMVRSAVIAAREAGDPVDSGALLETARHSGMTIAGYAIGAALVAGLDGARPLDEGQRELRQSDLGGAALWLRAEPGDDPAQAARLAAIIASGAVL
jgi:hypothetical protein